MIVWDVTLELASMAGPFCPIIMIITLLFVQTDVYFWKLGREGGRGVTGELATPCPSVEVQISHSFSGL